MEELEILNSKLDIEHFYLEYFSKIAKLFYKRKMYFYLENTLHYTCCKLESQGHRNHFDIYTFMYQI